jgi:hypothetical protein
VRTIATVEPRRAAIASVAGSVSSLRALAALA